MVHSTCSVDWKLDLIDKRRLKANGMAARGSMSLADSCKERERVVHAAALVRLGAVHVIHFL